MGFEMLPSRVKADLIRHQYGMGACADGLKIRRPAMVDEPERAMSGLQGAVRSSYPSDHRPLHDQISFLQHKNLIHSSKRIITHVGIGYSRRRSKGMKALRV